MKTLNFEMRNSLIKGKSDSRIYEFIRLENNLRCILVSDSTAKKSAIQLSIQVGSLDDPKDIPGLSHLLEHMLFDGSEKYPNAKQFQEFVKINGGYYNGSTQLNLTSYLFSINNDHFDEALDQFANFFICPNLNNQGIQKEILIIDSEYQYDLDNQEKNLEEIFLHETPELSQFQLFPCGKIGRAHV